MSPLIPVIVDKSTTIEANDGDNNSNHSFLIYKFARVDLLWFNQFIATFATQNFVHLVSQLFFSSYFEIFLIQHLAPRRS